MTTQAQVPPSVPMEQNYPRFSVLHPASDIPRTQQRAIRAPSSGLTDQHDRSLFELLSGLEKQRAAMEMRVASLEKTMAEMRPLVNSL
jgi:hypothetical protein